MPLSFGERVYRHRLAQGFRLQAKLAEKAHVNKGTIVRCERGGSLTDKSKLKIAKALGFPTIEEFWDAPVPDLPLSPKPSAEKLRPQPEKPTAGEVTKPSPVTYDSETLSAARLPTPPEQHDDGTIPVEGGQAHVIPAGYRFPKWSPHNLSKRARLLRDIANYCDALAKTIIRGQIADAGAHRSRESPRPGASARRLAGRRDRRSKRAGRS